MSQTREILLLAVALVLAGVCSWAAADGNVFLAWCSGLTGALIVVQTMVTRARARR